MELKELYPCPISYTDWQKARRAFAKYEGSKKKGFMLSWDDFLYKINFGTMGVRNNRVMVQGGTINYSVTQKTYNIIQLALSPHADTLLRAYWFKLHNSKKQPNKIDTSHR